jgi:nitrate reductase delta subunit
VSVTLGALPAADRASVVRLVAGGPPTELVGLEPFAPPEVMPSAGAHR